MKRVDNESLAKSAPQERDKERLAMEEEFRWNELELLQKFQQGHLSYQNLIEIKHVNSEILAEKVIRRTWHSKRNSV